MRSLSNTHVTEPVSPVIRKSRDPEEMKKCDDSEISMITVETYELQHDRHLVGLDQDPVVFPHWLLLSTRWLIYEDLHRGSVHHEENTHSLSFRLADLFRRRFRLLFSAFCNCSFLPSLKPFARLSEFNNPIENSMGVMERKHNRVRGLNMNWRTRVTIITKRHTLLNRKLDDI